MTKRTVKEEVKTTKRLVREQTAPVRSIGRIIFLDILRDERARPVLGYVAGTIAFGTVIYKFLEGWSWLDSIYFVVVSLTTIGYGDLAPTKPITKLLTIFYAVNGVAILLLLIDEIRRLRLPIEMVVKSEEE